MLPLSRNSTTDKKKTAARSSSRLEHIVEFVVDVKPRLLHFALTKKTPSKYVAYSKTEAGSTDFFFISETQIAAKNYHLSRKGD